MMATGATYLEKHVLQNIENGVGVGKRSDQLESGCRVLRGWAGQISWGQIEEKALESHSGAGVSPSGRSRGL